MSACSGETIGANFDPSHLWWQGIDPIVSLKAIAAAGALFNVHAAAAAIELAGRADSTATIANREAPVLMRSA